MGCAYSQGYPGRVSQQHKGLPKKPGMDYEDDFPFQSNEDYKEGSTIGTKPSLSTESGASSSALKQTKSLDARFEELWSDAWQDRQIDSPVHQVLGNPYQSRFPSAVSIRDLRQRP